MKKRNKVMFLIYFLLIGLLLFISPNVTDVVNALDYVACGSATGIPKPLPQITTIAYTVLMVGGPLVLVISAIMTLIKASSRNDSDEIEKAKNKLLRKFLFAALLFLISTMTQFFLGRVTSTKSDQKTMATCMKCFLYFNNKDCVPSTSGNDVEEGTYSEAYSNVANAGYPPQICDGNKVPGKLNKSLFEPSDYAKSQGLDFWWPLEKVGVGSSWYGIRKHPIEGVCKLHAGSDLPASMKDGSYAMEAGKVIEVSYSRANTGWGTYVKIEHKNGYYSLYAHHEKIFVKAGDRVVKGQLLGCVGSTGASTGPHLHFEIYHPNTENALKYYNIPENSTAYNYDNDYCDYRCMPTSAVVICSESKGTCCYSKNDKH